MSRQYHKIALDYKSLYTSPDFSSVRISSSDVNLKSVFLILSSKGFTDFICPTNFASIITPSVPVNLIPNCSAYFLPLKSYIISKQSLCSIANAIALASPLSSDASSIF